MNHLETCKLLLVRLQRGESVAAWEMKGALGEEHWSEYQMLRDWAKTQRAEAKIASHELRDYVGMLRIADLRQAQADRMRARTGKLMRRGKRPGDLYEKALQVLSHLIERNPQLAESLDRAFWPDCWNGNSDISPDKESVPRLWFHTENALPQPAERQIKTARQLKIDALLRAINSPPPPPPLATTTRIKTVRRPKIG